MGVANRVKERMQEGMKRLVPIVIQQKARDVSEADTVTLVKDLLSDVMGYDKYAELTSEHSIRGTYCDLAIKVSDKLVKLIEVKAIGTALDDRHVKQAVDYASNQGVEWVMLTNGIAWRLYQVIFAKPIDKRLLIEIDLTTLDMRKADSIESLYLFTKEGFAKGAMIELRDRQDATSRFTLGALIVHNDNVRAAIRRELRRVVDVLVDDDVIAKALRTEVIKRDVLEGSEAEAAEKRVNRRENRSLRTSPSEPEEAAEPAAAATAAAPAGDSSPQSAK